MCESAIALPAALPGGALARWEPPLTIESYPVAVFLPEHNFE
jgi:hypothetical protein